MFLFLLLLVILIIIWTTKPDNLNQENFFICPCKNRKLNKFNKFPYNPIISTPQTNHNMIIDKINTQQTYKNELSTTLSPIPTINCSELNNKTDCNNYGCNWFGSSDIKNINSFCSSTYPTQL